MYGFGSIIREFKDQDLHKVFHFIVDIFQDCENSLVKNRATFRGTALSFLLKGRDIVLELSKMLPLHIDGLK